MSIVTVQDSGNVLDRANRILAGFPRGTLSAAHAALQRAGQRARTEARRAVSQEYYVKVGDFNKAVTYKATEKTDGNSVTSVSLNFTGHVIKLISFDTKVGQDGRVVTHVKRGNAAQALDHAFARPVFGEAGVFERKTSRRFPVRQLYGPAIPQMLNNDEVKEMVEDVVVTTFEQRMEHEILRVLNGWGA